MTGVQTCALPILGILKLNYKNGYTHYTETVEGAPVNSIIQQRACLPTQSGKVEEGALVDLTDYSLWPSISYFFSSSRME